jgi:nitric oxide reductase NorD protein
MPTDLHQSLEPLALANPELAAEVASRLARKTAPVERQTIEQLVEEALWAFDTEASFGWAVALGYAELVAEVPAERLETYHRWLRDAGEKGPTLGRILAECLPPALVHGDEETLSRFKQAWDAMARLGAHALREPLLGLGPLLTGGERAAAHLYLELLHTIFAADPSYEEVRYFSIALPTAIRQLAPQRRNWQLREIIGLARLDRRLVEPFLSGLSRGLGLLREKALRNFVAGAMDLYRRERTHAARWLALESLAAQERFGALQISVGFAQVHDRLRRYLHARTGLALSIRPLSALAGAVRAALGPGRWVCSDAQAIYLPDEIEHFEGKEQNAELYRLLVRLEASFHEFGTFDFDGEKALEECRSFIDADSQTNGLQLPGRSDLEAFIGLFPDPLLAAGLFTIFELGRIRKCLEKTYGGLVRRFYPMLRDAFSQTGGISGSQEILPGLLSRVALGVSGREGDSLVEEVAVAFEADISAACTVEVSALMAARFFKPVSERMNRSADRSLGLTIPFDWRPWPNPGFAGSSPSDRLVEKIRGALAVDGLTAYRSDIKRRLKAGAGNLTPEDIRTLCAHPSAAAARLEAILSEEGGGTSGADGQPPEEGPVFRYPEWDERLGDYLPEHVRLRERMTIGGSVGYYSDVLRRHDDLVRQTRRAFERLRPEGLKRLRRWLDGDEFDYRQLIDAAVDRRMGDMPSDRLFVKRVKDRREVAVLLLVDLSRSTANRVPGSESSVLEIEKEAIVILCEALTILGDSLSVAGFSGSGRLGVDYFRIKGFDEPLSEDVKLRIGGLQPQRNTRMGAAIRHSVRELASQPASVRLLMILSDGFPNDTEYKGSHAVADTRQARTELNARGIRFHALTVNLPADPQLDQLYGKARHHVVSDVRELPGRLLRVYSALTR